jgi:signal transduction histidine kinase
VPGRAGGCVRVGFVKLRSPLRRQTLWVGFVAVLVPLAVLLGLQYRWLRQLDSTSGMVHRAALVNFIEGVSNEVAYSYRNDAGRVLNLPPAVFTQGHLDKAAIWFRKKGVEDGVSRLFVMSFADGPDGAVLFFLPSCSSFVPPSWSPEVRAVWVATAPWRILAHKNETLERVALTVDEKDPRYRILINPITDDSSRIVGLAGMILDTEYFEHRLLPRAVEKSLLQFFSGEDGQSPIVSVWDGQGRLVYRSEPEARQGKSEITKAFPFVFTDWKIGLASRSVTPAEVARRSFVLNFLLSLALAAALLGGLALAFQTASRQMRLSQMKSDFVSNVSHELRTPLASIRVFGEFLRLGRVDSPEKAREYGDYIETESRRLTQLVNNILDFASIESGRKSYRFETACVEEVVGETLKTFGVRLRQSGFRISYTAPETPLPPVHLDCGAIAQSLSNLLDNAVKYSEGAEGAEGDTNIEAGVRHEPGWIVIWVRDHGIGIPKDEQAKIFERFHRVGTGLVHDVKGSGLGLSIVQHIVQAHHGRVTVESRPGEGSTFSIHLPVDAVPNPLPRTSGMVSETTAATRPSEA